MNKKIIGSTSILKNKPIKVLVVGARGIPDIEGGAEKNAEALFPRFASAGYDVTLMGLAKFLKIDNYRGVKLLKAPQVNFAKTDKLLYYFFAVWKSLSIRADIVHLQGLGSAIFLLAYKFLGFKTVVRYGSADYILGKWGYLGKLGFMFSEWQLRFADAVISVTPSLSSRLASKGITRNVHMIPNALDVPLLERSPKSEAPYVLMVGRVTAQKNILLLLDAFATFSERHPEYELIIAGGLDDLDYIEQVRQKLKPNVKLLGRIPRSDVPALLVGADLFVNISIHEGSSNATLEAISYRTPVLISAIPENLDIGLPEGIYVDPLDPNAVALKIEAAIDNPSAFILDLGQFLTWEDVSARTLDVYRQVLSR